MRAFEVYLNRKKLCVAGLDDQGQLLFTVISGQNLKGQGGIFLNMTGMLLTQETVRWQYRTLRMNDELRIKIVEARTADTFEVLQKAPRDSRKYEKAWVRRMAKEFGWKIETKPRRP
jgi:hypothetical protein